MKERNNIMNTFLSKLKNAYLLLPLLLTGCDSNSDIFEHVRNEDAMDDLVNSVSTTGDGVHMSLRETMAQYSFSIAKSLQGALPFVLCISILIGVLGIIIVKKDQKVRRTCIVWFIVVIPLLYLLITGLMTAAASSFL